MRCAVSAHTHARPTPAAVRVVSCRSASTTACSSASSRPPSAPSASRRCSTWARWVGGGRCSTWARWGGVSGTRCWVHWLRGWMAAEGARELPQSSCSATNGFLQLLRPSPSPSCRHVQPFLHHHSHASMPPPKCPPPVSPPPRARLLGPGGDIGRWHGRRAGRHHRQRQPGHWRRPGAGGRPHHAAVGAAAVPGMVLQVGGRAWVAGTWGCMAAGTCPCPLPAKGGHNGMGWAPGVLRHASAVSRPLPLHCLTVCPFPPAQPAPPPQALLLRRALLLAIANG